MVKIAAINEIPHLKPQGPVSKRGCCGVILKIVAAVANFFRIAWLWMCKTTVWLKDRLIDLLPERIAMRLDPRRIFVRTVLNIASDQRAAFLEQALPCISPQMDRDTRDQLVQLVENESSARLSRSMLRFVTPDMYSHESIKTTDAIAAVLTDRQDAVATNADPLMAEELRRASRRAIIEAISAIPTQERKEVIRNTSLLITPRMNGIDRARLIRVVANIPVKERETVTALALLLITPRMGQITRSDMIQAIADVPFGEREIVTMFAFQALEGAENGHFKQAIVEVVAAIPAVSRADVMQHAVQLISRKMHVQDRVEIICKLTCLPKEQWVVYARSCMHEKLLKRTRDPLSANRISPPFVLEVQSQCI